MKLTEMKLAEAIIAFFDVLFEKHEQSGVELPSPYNKIKISDVRYDEPNRQIIIENIEPPVRLTTVGKSNSQEPWMDYGHLFVLSSNKKYIAEEELKVGDVVIWEKEVTTRHNDYSITEWKQIIHSIYDIGKDGDGWYCITKGLNNEYPDPWKIRWTDIMWVDLMTVWCEKPEDSKEETQP